MASSGKIEIEKFNGQTFELWKLKMEDLLVDKDQWIAVDPGTKPTRVSNEEWKKLDRKAKSTIRLCVLDSVLLNVLGEATVKALWDKLRTLYQSKSLVNKLFLRKKLYNLRMKDGDLVTEHLNAFNIVTEKKIKVLRADNGGEFCSKEFEEFCKKCGIARQKTTPYTPQQNGVAERMNKMLMQRARSMLNGARLGQEFWAEAVDTACYLVNRSPSSALDDKTLQEVWTGKKPSLSHLKVFECDAYVHVPKENRTKLDSKSEKCIFIGFMSKPGKEHWTAVKWVFKYLRGTSDYGLCYQGRPGWDRVLDIRGFIDADWARDLDQRRSTSGYVFNLFGRVVSWMSNKQSAVALSTIEAEYMAATHASKEAVWLQRLCSSMGLVQGAIRIDYDSKSANFLAKNPAYHSKTKHIDVQYHFVRDTIEDKKVLLVKVDTLKNTVDALTKSVSSEKFSWCRETMGISGP
eukprot:PITA_21756